MIHPAGKSLRLIPKSEESKIDTTTPLGYWKVNDQD